MPKKAVCEQLVQRMRLPVGGLAYCSYSSKNSHQLAVSCAGPVVHIPLFLAFYFIAHYALDNDPSAWYIPVFTPNFIPNDILKSIIYNAIDLQVLLFLFNVFLPIYPLDGGKIFICLIRCCSEPSDNTLANICITTSLLFGGALTGYCIYRMNWFGVFLCAWLLYQIYEMWVMKRKNELHLHPLFRKDTTVSTVQKVRDNRGAYHTNM
jgi:hypothetical protein